MRNIVRDNECNREAKEKTGIEECHPGWDKRRVSLPQRLKWPMK
jgi:hypothetical protein